MNNLEHFKFSEVENNQGQLYSDFRKKLTPHYFRAWGDIGFGYLLCIGTLILSWFLERLHLEWGFLFVQITIGSAVFGFWVSFLQLFVHEAAHYNLHPEKKRNDFLANFFLSYFVGLDVKNYRLTHWKHHASLGKQVDSENSYFNDLRLSFILKLLTGIHAVETMLKRNDNPSDEGFRRRAKRALLCGLIINVWVVSGFVFFQSYGTAMVWIIGVGIFYPFWTALRQLLEHRNDKYKGQQIDFHNIEHGKTTRIFSLNLFSYFLGGAGFVNHMIHHWDPKISYSQLNQAKKFLQSSPECKEIIVKSETTYLNVFSKLFVWRK
ncbi:MAG: fatty acid desaturase [Sphingobacteriales bacterium]|jgi:fatty acid desaturase